MSDDLFPENIRTVTLAFNSNKKYAFIGGVFDTSGKQISGRQWQRYGREIHATYTRAQLRMCVDLMREPTADEAREWRARRLAIQSRNKAR